MSTRLDVRIERDSMGEMEVPAEALYGASTMRAVLNFPISGLRFPRTFIRALGLVKQAAAKTNMSLGLLEEITGNAIVSASQEVIDGSLDEHFVLDIFQTGSGTSTNTNANEVIANRASQIRGGELGSRLVHPNDHVNMGQSSNDVIPTAIHLAALLAIKEDLIPALEFLAVELGKKSDEFWPVVKTGRTHLQDATPVRLGQEFRGFAGQAEYSVQRLNRAQEALAEVALGGTAVGTGVNTHEEFSARTCMSVSEASGVFIKETANHFQAQASLDALVETSGELKTIAISLHKIANDIRFIASGPRAGLGEIALPEVQPGSSIMPGKINPVISESVIQVVAQVVGNDASVTLAGQGGYFELNTMMPVAAHNILQSIALLATSAHNFADQCVTGITATSVGPDMVEKGLMLGTALAPAIGYDAAAAIAKEASAKGTTIREMAKEKTELSDAELDELLDLESMTEPGIGAAGPGGGG
ncbi:MAG: aspartate ammonia-lyase [SAR202 cluster bacterium Io17-Chloro-G6]|nr:MAG: aspartate ammonia-lyase [SAR202 cluster bacterium Io17-Chloro-G6]